MTRWRWAFGVTGALLGLFGGFRLFTEVPMEELVMVGVWLVAAAIIHEGILSPVVVGAGWLISRVVPPRARRYLQAGLIVGGLVTVIAIPLIYREDTQPEVKAILLQNYGANLTLLLALIGAVSLLAYAVRVARDHRSPQP